MCLHLHSIGEAVILEELGVRAGVFEEAEDASSQVRDGPMWRWPYKLVNMFDNVFMLHWHVVVISCVM